MIHLKVYSDADRTQQFWLDLYPTEPIKLNLSVEDITDAEARSVFSRTFRVPATTNNNAFFKNAFLIDGIDYDVTTKKPAEILVDGAEFRVGHIRLQKIFKNADTDRIDYEIVFFGETRDFASSVGQGTLADLDTGALTHNLSYTDIATSWQAYPQGNSTDGLFDGNLLYPLVDFGNTYTDGIPNEPRIAFGPASDHNFNHSNNAIQPQRLKPMLRAKWIIDKIFSEAGFSYQSNFFDSDLFRKLYVSAWGNTVDIDIPNIANQNILEVYSSFTQTLTYTGGGLANSSYVIFTNEVQDPGNNWQSYEYVAPAAGNYTFDIRSVDGMHDVLGGVTVGLARQVGGAGSWNFIPGTTQSFTNQEYFYQHNSTEALTAGDKIRLVVQANSTNVGAPQFNNVSAGANFNVTSAPGNFTPSTMLDNEYKQIDFIKDILTTFRLVMSPSKDICRAPAGALQISLRPLQYPTI